MKPITAQRPCLGDAELEAVGRVFASGWLGMGSVTEAFERRLTELLGVRHVVAVSSCTAALHLSLASLELAADDEVIVPSLTYPGTIQAIVAVGARPVFCEVEPTTLNMDVADVLGRITRRTRAILPVHYGGQPCDMVRLLAWAEESGGSVIEDAAHAFGSYWHGQPIGGIGDATCFSFDPIKNITCGQGGAIATNQDHLAESCRRMRTLGIVRRGTGRLRGPDYWRYDVVSPGFRYHMNDFNAAIGLVQLDRLEEFTARRQTLVRRYDEHLAGLPGLALLHRDLDSICPFSYVVRVLDGRREALFERLRANNILPHVQFIPNHLQPVWTDSRLSLPVTEALAGEILTLPLYIGLSDEQQDLVIGLVRDFSASYTQLPVEKAAHC